MLVKPIGYLDVSKWVPASTVVRLGPDIPEELARMAEDIYKRRTQAQGEAGPA